MREANMNSFRHALIVVSIAALSACATQGTLPDSGQPEALGPLLGETVISDLDKAIAVAKAGGDSDGEKCWTELKNWIVALKSARDAVDKAAEAGGKDGAPHLFTIQEKLRLDQNAIRNGVPKNVHTACAPILVDAQTALLRLSALVRKL